MAGFATAGCGTLLILLFGNFGFLGAATWSVGSQFAANGMACCWGVLLAVVWVYGCLPFVLPNQTCGATGILGRWLGSSLTVLPLAPLVLSAAADLWSSPSHVAAALGGPVGLAFSFWFGRRGIRYGAGWLFALAAVLTAGLGISWNHVQTAGNWAWAWDWIEACPVLLGIATVGAAHGWARAPWWRSPLAFGACLQLGRNALTLSLHHAQTPVEVYQTWGCGAPYMLERADKWRPSTVHPSVALDRGIGGAWAGAALLALCGLSAPNPHRSWARQGRSRSYTRMPYGSHTGLVSYALLASTGAWGVAEGSTPTVTRGGLLYGGGWGSPFTLQPPQVGITAVVKCRGRACGH